MGKNPTIAPGVHSDIGASSLSRLIACAGSFRLARQITPDQRVTTIYAATGTVAHALAEDAMKASYDPMSRLGEVITVAQHDVPVTMEMVDALRIYIDLVKSWRQQGATVWLETQVVLDEYWPANARPPVSAFGTADALAYQRNMYHLDVGDYKNGAGVFVDVEDNPQVLYYAAGALQKLKARGRPVRTITTHIVQPNVRGAEKVRSQNLTAADVLMWVHDVLKPTIANVLVPDAPLHAGKHCKFCPARVGCPARNQLRQEAARRDFGANNENLVNFSVHALADALDELDILEAHAKALREHAIERIQAGESIPRWTLTPTRPVRSWDKTANIQTLGDQIPSIQDPSELLAPGKLRSPAEMEKFLGSDWTWVERFVVSKSSGVKLARDDDPDTHA
jgi:hypothetical protein